MKNSNTSRSKCKDNLSSFDKTNRTPEEHRLFGGSFFATRIQLDSTTLTSKRSVALHYFVDSSARYFPFIYPP